MVAAMKLVRRFVPIVKWLPNYTKIDAIGDLVAGITLGLTIMPQSIAYASLAGLTAQYGLYSAFMGSIVYVFFGTIKEASIGITSLMALMTFEYTYNLSVEFVILLTFLTGCVQLLMGALNLGIMVDFISAPVTSGFTTAAAMIVIVSQIKGLLGLRFKSHSTIDNIWQIFKRLDQVKLWDATLGFSCIIILLLMRKLKDIPTGSKNGSKKTKQQHILKKTLWFLSISRNALTVLFSSILAYMLTVEDVAPFRLSGKIKPGLPSLHFPPFSAELGNTTYSFFGMCSELGSGIVLVPVVGVLANVAIAKAFSTGATLDATQEMITLGLCNVCGSFVQSVPSTGAFTRSAVSHASGIKTPLGGLYSGIIILLALSYLTPYFYYIPRSTLSAVLISAVIFMMEFKIMGRLWKRSKRDLALLVLTLVSCIIFGVEVGLILGTICNALELLYLWARPNINIRICKIDVDNEYLRMTPDVGLYYPAIDYLRTEVCKIAMEEPHRLHPVVLDFTYIKGTDYTTTKTMQLLLNDFSQQKQCIVFFNVRPDIIELFHDNGLNNFHIANSEEELADILFGEKLDTLKMAIADTDSHYSKSKLMLQNDQSHSEENDAEVIGVREFDLKSSNEKS